MVQKECYLHGSKYSIVKFKILEAEHNGRKYRIEEDFPEVGVYLYVYEGDKCTYDYLQNDIEKCMEFALKNFYIPLNKWKSIDG